MKALCDRPLMMEVGSLGLYLHAMLVLFTWPTMNPDRRTWVGSLEVTICFSALTSVALQASATLV